MKKARPATFSPRVAIRLQALLPTLSYQDGRVELPGTEIYPRVLIPSLGQFRLPDMVWGATLFPFGSQVAGESAERVIRRIEKDMEKGKELSPDEAAQLAIARQALEIARSNPGQMMAAHLVVAPRDPEGVHAISQSGRWLVPAHTWTVALTSLLPSAPPIAFPNPELYFAVVPQTLPYFPASPPPPPLPANPRSFYMGMDVDRGAVVWSPWETVNPHLGISGYSGSGKSALCRLLVFQAALQSPPVPLTVIDPKGEWTKQAPHLRSLGVAVTTVSDRELYCHRLPTPPEVFDAFLPEGRFSPAPQRAQALASILYPLLGEDAPAIANRAADAEDWFEVYRLSGEDRRLHIFDPDGAWANALRAQAPWPLDADCSIFGLAALTGAAMGDQKTNDFFVFLLVLAISEALKRKGQAIILVDEAHVLLRLPATRMAVEILLRVARSAGLAVILASQYWADLYLAREGQEPLASQCATRVILRPSSEEMADIGKYMPEILSDVQAVMDAGVPGAGVLLFPGGQSLFRVIVPQPAQRFCFAT